MSSLQRRDTNHKASNDGMVIWSLFVCLCSWSGLPMFRGQAPKKMAAIAISLDFIVYFCRQ